MGFHNPEMQWSELVRTLEGKAPRREPDPEHPDAPMSRKRAVYTAPPIERPVDAVPYAELHAHSSYSFLDGVSSPVELVEEAERLGLTALALTDHDGYYGIARFAEAAEHLGVETVFGSELSLGRSLSERIETEGPAPMTGTPDPDNEHLLLLARGPEGYHALSGAITEAHLRGGEKGRPVYEVDELVALRGRVIALTGCRKGGVRRALEAGRPDAAGSALDRLVDWFGRDGVLVELTDHGDPLDTRRNDILAGLAAERSLPIIATNAVHYARPDRARLAEAVAAVRANRSLDELDGWLPAHDGAHLRSGAEMLRRFRRYPGAVERTVEVARELAFELRKHKPALPQVDVPSGHTPMSYLRELVWNAMPTRYPGLDDEGRERIEQELDVIDRKGFAGYFLIVRDIVVEAKRLGILCQARGSAAASVVCFLLGITAVDALKYKLPFERFISTLRAEEPDIDVDFDSERREEIIQYVFKKYGRRHAAQVCNVIQYRPRFALRDMARALGYSPGQQDAFAKEVERGSLLTAIEGGVVPRQVLEYTIALLKAPRHLGIHSGGMVLTDRPVGEVVPIEHARMKDRTVIQWDKDDAEGMGLVKFDLLGLGMLAALQRTFDLVEAATGERIDLDSIPKEEPEVYDMLCRADAIGVFQVESRAQLSLLPRLRPREFYHLAIEIALIRPGPIQGGAVHPFVERKMRRDRELQAGLPLTEIPYPHPALEPVLERTLGIPVFQEQLLQMAQAIGGLDPAEADLLRRAMGSKRGIERIESVKAKLYAGMAEKGLVGDAADAIYAQILAFADFGFAESHSLSFALLVYASSWLKLHYPAAFLAGLLDSQPMGFYSPATLVADARRHGVQVLRPDLAVSQAKTALEPVPGRPGGSGAAPSTARGRDPDGAIRYDTGWAVRLGLSGINGIGLDVAEAIVAERERGGPYRSMADLVRRTDLTQRQLEALAAAGAFASLDLQRREALWQAGAAATDRAVYLEDSTVVMQPPLFPDQTAAERLAEDLRMTGLSVDDHPIAHFRAGLDDRGVLPSEALREAEVGRRIEVAGLVTHRQRPSTASGITFLNLEDEHGLVNIVCSKGVWSRYRRIARDSNALIIRGVLERNEAGVIGVLADRFEALPLGGLRHAARDFQ